MNTSLFEIELNGVFNLQDEATRHGRASRRDVGRPGRIGAFLLGAEAIQPRLYRRSAAR